MTGFFISFALADNYNIFTDNGIPENTADPYVWPSGAATPSSFRPVSSPDAPEGTIYQRLSYSSWAGWGIFYRDRASSINLSNYIGGDLKFWVSTNVNLKVEIQDRLDRSPFVYIGAYGWDGTARWQKIIIPLSAFGTAVDFSSIYSPFSITAETACDFSVDKVYWTIPISPSYRPNIVRFSTSRNLLINGNTMIVLGVNATITPRGQDSSFDWSIHPELYTTDFDLMKKMGVNVIRTYKPITTARSLDEAQVPGPTGPDPRGKYFLNEDKHRIYVIMGFHVDPLAITTASGRENIRRNFLEMVEHWKNHPAILMWCLGNEVTYGLVPADIGTWYSLLNECAGAAKGIDPNHPVITVIHDNISEISLYNSRVPNLDMWGVNVYRGRSFGRLFSEYRGTTNKPLIITEFGCDRYNSRSRAPDELTQADYLSNQLLEISANLPCFNPVGICVGGCVFSWRDEWWKNGNPSIQDTTVSAGVPEYRNNEEWWGVLDIDRNIKNGYYIIQQNYIKWWRKIAMRIYYTPRY